MSSGLIGRLGGICQFANKEYGLGGSVKNNIGKGVVCPEGGDDGLKSGSTLGGHYHTSGCGGFRSLFIYLYKSFVDDILDKEVCSALGITDAGEICGNFVES